MIFELKAFDVDLGRKFNLNIKFKIKGNNALDSDYNSQFK